jgi:hypothetical protein
VAWAVVVEWVVEAWVDVAVRVVVVRVVAAVIAAVHVVTATSQPKQTTQRRTSKLLASRV